MIDSHCHLEFRHFDKDREDVIAKSKDSIEAVVNSGADTETLDQILTLNEEHPNFIFPTLGLHPTRALEKTREEIDQYLDDIRNEKERIVGVGEVGLDYYHVEEDLEREKCRRVFEKFIDLSEELGLPLVVHSRGSMADSLKILEGRASDVIIHCFSGEIHHLEEALDRGYYLSYGGVIFRSRKKYERLLERTPLENLLLETDAPFLAKRKNDRSEPWFIREVAEEISYIKEMDFSEVWRTAGNNSIDVFELGL